MDRRQLLLLALVSIVVVGSGCHYCGPRPFTRPIFHGGRFRPALAGPAIGGPVSAPGYEMSAGSPAIVGGAGYDSPIYGGPAFTGGIGGPGCTGCTGASASPLVQPQPVFQLGGFNSPVHPSAGLPTPMHPSTALPMGGSEQLGPPTILPPGPKVEIVPQVMPKTKDKF